VFTLEDSAISLKFTNQTIGARSTMEAEFVALDVGCVEAE